MKKFVFLGAAVIAAMMTACSGNNASADLKDNVDSLAYDLGYAQSQALKQYMTTQLGVDSTQIDEFIKGLQDGAKAGEDKSREAYLKGLQVAEQVKGMAQGLTQQVYADDTTKSVNVSTIVAGLVKGLKATEAVNADSIMQSFEKRMEPIQEKNMLAKYSDNKAAGEKFLAANMKKDGVKTTKSGLQYKVLVEGNGELPTDTTTLTINYEGKFVDGTVFDSSYERKQPMTMNLQQEFIEGFKEAVKMMPAGSTWEVYIPYNLAYGTKEMGQIKPFSALIFKIEVMK